jgi:hypothetical protein
VERTRAGRMTLRDSGCRPMIGPLHTTRPAKFYGFLTVFLPFSYDFFPTSGILFYSSGHQCAMAVCDGKSLVVCGIPRLPACSSPRVAVRFSEGREQRRTRSVVWAVAYRVPRAQEE